MGTTSDKLTYLNTTKTKIKDAINLANTNITNETFRQYESKIKQALINTMNDKWGVWDNFEKVIGTGETLTLNNTAQAPMKIDLKGNTSQYTTTGKNLLNVPSSYSLTGNIIINVGSLPAGTYSVSLKSVTLGGEYTAWLRFMNSDFEYASVQIDATHLSHTVTTTGTTTSIIIYSQNNYSHSQGVTTTFKELMIVSGSSAGDYEPYTNGASPNPDYPQPVNVVTGDNTINICGKNLFTIKNYVKSGWNITIDNPLKGLSTGNYTISCVNKYITADKGIAIVFSNGTGGNIGYFTGYNFGSTLMNQTRNITQEMINANYLVIMPQDSLCTQEVLENMKIMIEKGSTASTFEPYTSQTYPIYLGVENLLKYPYRDTTKEENGITFTDIGDGTIKVNGTASANTYFYLTTNNDDTYKKYNGKKLTISGCPSGGGNNTYQIGFFNDNFSVGTADNGNGGTFTGGDVRYNQAYIKINSGVQCDNLIFKPQLEFGTKKNSYTPYGTTPIELCKIGDYKDYIYKDNGSWYIHKEIGKVVLNGSENWGKTALFYANNLLSPIAMTNSECFSNYFSYSFNASANNSIYIANQGTAIWINSNKFETASDFQTWLSNNNTIVYYVLATPTITEITDTTLISQLEALKGAMSYKGQTNIMQVPYDKPFIITASALKAI